jgi:hypothetical protein
VLAATAVAKLAGILLKSPLLRGVEPLTGWSLPVVAALSAAGELVLAGLLFHHGTVLTGTALTFVFAVGALGYRLLILSPQAPCACLGGISRWLPGLALYERNLLLMILIWLLLTAGGVLVHQRLQMASRGEA